MQTLESAELNTLGWQFDPVAATRTEFPMFFNPMQPTLKNMAQRVLFDEKLASSILPKLEVVYIWCQRAQWYCVYGMIETERQYKEHVEQGHRVRPIRFIELEGANHFVSVALSLALVVTYFGTFFRFTGMTQKTSGLGPSMSSRTRNPWKH